jgi:DNA-binding NarL/FixJ family response regulator
VTISVLLADDQALVRTGFRLVLNGTADLRVVGEAGDGADAVRMAASTRPDVVLMDVRMPGMDGIEATRRITSQTECRVLILTTFDLDEYAYDGLRAGASGFLLKDVPPEGLFEAIRAVASGDAVLTPRVTRDLVDRFARTPEPEPARRDPSGRFADLTAREVEVFGQVAQGRTNAEIARTLVLTEATVKTHVTRVLAKLGLRNRVQMVIFAYERGLNLPT